MFLFFLPGGQADSRQTTATSSACRLTRGTPLFSAASGGSSKWYPYLRERLIFRAFGFAGKDRAEFHLLQHMVVQEASAAGVAHAAFTHGVDAKALRKTLLGMSSLLLLTLTVSKLSSLIVRGPSTAASGR